MTSHRLAEGGARIDRARRLAFTFDGETIPAFSGDTVASALLASGRMLVARSFKYHRPRGIYSAGPEEPNALVTLGTGAETEPNARATMVEAEAGLIVRSQNAWPSLALDFGAVGGLLGPFFSAGFYYKTFMGPFHGAWMLYEPFIRRAAGLGKASLQPDPGRYEKANGFCDVAIVGSGAAGLAAALVAGRAGARVILLEDHAALGGNLDLRDGRIEGTSPAEWGTGAIAELAGLANIRLMLRTSVYGYYDGNVLAAVERIAGALDGSGAVLPRMRHWRIQARRVVLACGAFPRPIVFSGNDVPGVMLLPAALAYARRYGVAVGRSVAIFANNDRAWAEAAALSREGVQISAILDPRMVVPSQHAEELRKTGAAILTGSVAAAQGGRRLRGVRAVPLVAGRTGSGGRDVPCDALLVSGGVTPNIHLASQAGGPPRFHTELAAFVPGDPREAWEAAGSMTGFQRLSDALRQGAKAGARAARACGLAAEPVVPEADGEPAAERMMPLWETPPAKAGWRKQKAFVDLQNDVTADDVRLANREGFFNVEHLKRYTTLGMATDQGKTSNLNGLAILSSERGLPMPAVGLTRFRAPYMPVTLGALAGREMGAHFRPLRRTPLDAWHVAAGADMLEVGAWRRPRAYRRPGESLREAYVREARAVRRSVGIADVSTLGKIDVQGPDAAVFLDRIYTNAFASLPVGKARYGLMLREDGFLFDDGTVWRLAETRYLMTTTTANAGPVMMHLERLLSTAWPDLRVNLTSVTEQWAGIAVSGPKARVLLSRVAESVDLGNEAFPQMGVREARIDGVPAWLARLSFSGELAYEVYVGADFGERIWTRLLDAGRTLDAIPYGLEALGALRIEKGHVTGAEIDGRTSVHDLGLEKMFSGKKTFVGKPLALRPALTDPGRRQLVGLRSLDGQAVLPGAQLVAGGDLLSPGAPEGHVTSSTYSPALERQIALALLAHGRARHGERLHAADPLRGTHVPVEVSSPHFYDPDGKRMNV